MFKNIFKFIFNNEHYFKILSIFFFLFFASIIELISIYSIYPLIEIIFNNDFTNFNTDFFKINLILNSNNDYLFILLIFLFLIIFSNILNFLSLFFINHFVYIFGYKLSIKIFKLYLHEQYQYLQKKNNNELIKNIINENQRLVNGILLQFFNIIPKTISIFFIIIMLLFINTKVTIISGVSIILFYLIYFQITKSTLISLGKDASSYLANMHKTLSEAFHMIDFIKIKNKYNFFIDRFKINSELFAKYNIKTSLISSFPRYFFEIIFFITIIVIIQSLLKTGRNISEFLPIIGIYLFSVLKIFPYLQSIYHSISTMNHNYNSFLILNNIYKSIPTINDNLSIDKSFNQISFRNIKFTYETNSDKCFEMSLDILKGDKIAITGKSGNGKSTFLKIIAGLLEKNSGEILKNHINIDNFKLYQTVNLSYLDQKIHFIDDSIKMNVFFSYEESNLNQLNQVLHSVNLHEFSGSNINNTVGDNGTLLSGGQRQRLIIAKILFENDDLLILDEFDTSLDKKNIDNLADLILMNKNKTVIFSTHNFNLLKFANKLYNVDNFTLKKMDIEKKI